MRMSVAIASVLLFALPWPAEAQGSLQAHELKASPATVHRGFFDASLKPFLTINSGDSVRLETASGNPLVAHKGLSREDAYMLSSAAMDLIVTQVVDGTKGIHAMMPKAIFAR